MNILPQKSWHVRRKENVERVRKDEAEAEARQAELEKRNSKAEAEYLRTRLGGTTASDIVSIQERSTGHVNLFWDRELDNSEKNKADHREKDVKKETDNWARKVGIVVGLNDKSEEKELHWVFGSNKETSKSKMSMSEELVADKKLQQDLKRKSSEDPINLFSKRKPIESYNEGSSQYSLAQKYSCELAYKALDQFKQQPQAERTSQGFEICNINNNFREKSNKNKEKKVQKSCKKETKKNKSGRKHNRSVCCSSSSGDERSCFSDEERKSKEKEKMMEKLRKERLSREERERKKAEELLRTKCIHF